MATRAKIEIQSIWEDDDLFEVRVLASNGEFAGAVNCYTQREEMLKLGMLLEGFPRSVKDEVNFTTYGNDAFSYFSVRFWCPDAAGHVKLRIKVAHIVTYTNAPQENDVAEFQLDVEPAAIDEFSASLKKLAKAELKEVSAVLNGKT